MLSSDGDRQACLRRLFIARVIEFPGLSVTSDGCVDRWASLPSVFEVSFRMLLVISVGVEGFCAVFPASIILRPQCVLFDAWQSPLTGKQPDRTHLQIQSCWK